MPYFVTFKFVVTYKLSDLSVILGDTTSDKQKTNWNEFEPKHLPTQRVFVNLEARSYITLPK